MIERFKAVAAKWADHCAVVDSDGGLTYAQLAERVSDEAGGLAGRAKGTRVTLTMPRGAAFLIRLLALWECGLVPIPLDPLIPAGRLAEIEALLQNALPDPAVAYAISTSGSSGKPKLVEVLPDGLLPMLEAQMRAFDIGPGDRALWMLSPGFDASLSVVGTALLSGATLVCAPDGCAEHLGRILAQHEITHLDLPPALLEVYSPDDLPSSLRTLVIGGAPCAPERLRAWAQRFRTISVYGPTEATICSSLSLVDQTWDAPHLGQPVAGLTYRVLDGELCIGGPGVARGYLGAESSQAFWIEDGLRWYRTGDLVKPSESHHGMVFAGRKDRQVKLHGQRIELEEIESRLRDWLGGNLAVVMGQQGLSVFWEGAGDAGGAKAALSQSLAASWLPRHWERLAALPRLRNGKIDLGQLARRPAGNTVITECDSLERARRAVEMERAGLAGASAGLLGGSWPELTSGELVRMARSLTGESRRAPASRRRKTDGRPTLLVTGGGGRLGRALLPLLQENFEVVALCHRSAVEGESLMGDLTEPRLGLSESLWRELRHRVDGVLNLGARLNAAAPLEVLIEANARPLSTMAELGVPVHHASSMAMQLAVRPRPNQLTETCEPDTVLGSYAQSKWVAEQLFTTLGLEGLVMRYGLLVGDPRPDDLLAMVIRGLLALGCYPTERADELAFDVTPLNYAASETLALLQSWPSSSRPTTSINAGVKVTLRELAHELESIGHPVRAVALEDFLQGESSDPNAWVAQLATTQTAPEWDLFLMTGVQVSPADADAEEVRSTLRRYIAALSL